MWFFQYLIYSFVSGIELFYYFFTSICISCVFYRCLLLPYAFPLFFTDAEAAHSSAQQSIAVGQTFLLNLEMAASEVEMCLPVLPLRMPNGVLTQKSATGLVFNGIIPVGGDVPTQADAMADLLRRLNMALEEHKAKVEADKTPPSSQNRVPKIPKFGPIPTHLPPADNMNDR